MNLIDKVILCLFILLLSLFSYGYGLHRGQWKQWVKMCEAIDETIEELKES